MDCVRLTDAELLGYIREGGEPYFSALHELEQRHFHAVRTFASACAVNPTAAEDLAYEAWQEAIRQRCNGSASGAVRPCVLSSVLRTASAWAGGAQRGVLNPQLAAWIDTNGPVMLGNTATSGFRRPSLVALAYANLSYRSQTIVWHRTVEHEGSAMTGRLTGVNPAQVPELSGPAQGELFYSYIQLIQDGVAYECRPYHELVLAGADARSGQTTAALAPHLEHCRQCARSVTDLERLRHDCGALLAQALLPWGGVEYASGLMQEAAGRAQTPPAPANPQDMSFPDTSIPGWNVPAASPPGTNMPFANMPGPSAAPPLPTFPSSPRPAVAAPPVLPALPPAFHMSDSPMPAFPTPDRGMGMGMGPGMGSGMGSPAATGKGRHAAAVSADTGMRGKGRRRTDLVVKSAAVVGVCAVAAAFAIVGGLDDDEGEAQAKGPANQQGDEPTASPKATPASKSPTPTKSKAATARPKPTASKTSKPKPPKPDPQRPSRPSVRNASVEWLFNDIDSNGVAADSSNNGKAGTLFGSSRPTPTKSGGLAFDGEQFVASSGPLVNTSRSFSVSARVKLNRTDVSQTVLSQDASDSSGFSLQYDADEERWEMRMPREETDAAEADGDEAVSVFQPKAGDWTTLTGVYDDADDELRLYVDGRLGETVEHEDDFESEGIFAVGRGLSDNKFFQGLQGTVDDVRAYGRALTTAEARALTRRS